MKAGRWILAVGLSAVCLGWALHGTDWEAFRRSLISLRSPGWLLIYPILMLFEYSLRTIRWQILFNPLHREKFRHFLPITAGGFFLNSVMPFRLGEAARLYWSHQKTKVPLSSCLTILAVDRVFDMLSLLFLLFVVGWNDGFLMKSTQAVWIFGLATVGGTIVLILMAHFPEKTKRLSQAPWMPHRLQNWAHQFIDGARALRQVRTFIGLFGLSLTFWCVTVTFMQFIAHLFSLPLSWTQAALVLLAFCLGALLPAAPGYVGTFEAAGVAALSLLGYTKSQSLPFILTFHICQILSSVIWGIPSLWFAGLSMKSVKGEGEKVTG